MTDKLLPFIDCILSENGSFYLVVIPENKPENILDVLNGCADTTNSATTTATNINTDINEYEDENQNQNKTAQNIKSPRFTMTYIMTRRAHNENLSIVRFDKVKR